MMKDVAGWLMAAELDGTVDLRALDRPPEALVEAFAEAYRSDDYSPVQGCSLSAARSHVVREYSW